MIQRKQTIYLLLAAIAMAVYAFMPVMGIVSDAGNFTVGAIAGINGITIPNYLILTLEAVITLLALVTIFKYKNLKFQSSLCKVNALLTVALIATIGTLLLMQRGKAIAALTLWYTLPFVTLIFLLLANGGIKHDIKLLRDSERLR